MRGINLLYLNFNFSQFKQSKMKRITIMTLLIMTIVSFAIVGFADNSPPGVEISVSELPQNILDIEIQVAQVWQAANIPENQYNENRFKTEVLSLFEISKGVLHSARNEVT